MAMLIAVRDAVWSKEGYFLFMLVGGDDLEMDKKMMFHRPNLLQLSDKEWDDIIYTEQGGLFDLCKQTASPAGWTGGMEICACLRCK